MNFSLSIHYNEYTIRLNCLRVPSPRIKMLLFIECIIDIVCNVYSKTLWAGVIRVCEASATKINLFSNVFFYGKKSEKKRIEKMRWPLDSDTNCVFATFLLA